MDDLTTTPDSLDAPEVPAPDSGLFPPSAPASPPAPIPTAPPKKRIGTGRILSAVGALVAIAIGGGIGALIVHGKNQHNQQVIAQAQTATGDKPQPQKAGVSADGSHFGPLFAFLLPIPSGYTLGPGDGDFGNNSYLTAAQAGGDIDGLLSGLPQSDMAAAKGALSALTPKGIAVRTYTDASASLVVETALVQVDMSDAAGVSALFYSTISDPAVFSQGPEVPGYDQADCVLPPELGSDTLDSMICVASSGDVEVRINAYGTAPLNTSAVTQLVSRQLDLLKTNQTIG